MSQFAGESVVSIEQLSIDHDARADACAKRNDNEIVHAPCHTILFLADGGRIGIVRHRHGEIVQAFAEHFSQRHHAVFCPPQISGILDGAGMIVGSRCTDAHGLYFGEATHLLNHGLKRLDASLDELFGRLVVAGFNHCGFQDVCLIVHDAEDGVGSA